MVQKITFKFFIKKEEVIKYFQNWNGTSSTKQMVQISKHRFVQPMRGHLPLGNQIVAPDITFRSTGFYN